jgi:hypothetical protein
MAKVTGLRNWRNGEIINARDYVYERNVVTTAINTNDDTLINHETRITTAEGDITALEGRVTTEEANVDNLQGRMTTAETDIENVEQDLSTHEARQDNPHNVTKSQVGLSNVNNTSDLNKPISTATQTALDAKANIASPTLTGTPLAPTATAGTNTTQIATTAFVTSQKGVANGVADLDAQGKIKIAQLPNAVFDSLHFYDVISANKTLAELAEETLEVFNAANSRSAVGIYYVANAARTITPSLSSVLIDGEYFSGFFKPSEESEDNAETPIVLETGDWIVLTKVSGSGTVGSPYETYWAVVNNTYENATTAIDGIVRLSSQGTYASLAGNNVITDGQLKTVIDNAAFATQTALDAKAPLASPTLTGTPAAPTATSGTNTTQIATTAFVKTAIDNVVNVIEKTYAQLAELKDDEELIPFAWYKITDYRTIYIQSGTYLTKTGPLEPLLIQAITNDSFSTEVFSTVHKKDRITYLFDNNSRFTWVDETSRGVIIRRIDEFDNDVCFDFRVVKHYFDTTYINANAGLGYELDDMEVYTFARYSDLNELHTGYRLDEDIGYMINAVGNKISVRMDGAGEYVSGYALPQVFFLVHSFYNDETAMDGQIYGNEIHESREIRILGFRAINNKIQNCYGFNIITDYFANSFFSNSIVSMFKCYILNLYVDNSGALLKVGEIMDVRLINCYNFNVVSDVFSNSVFEHCISIYLLDLREEGYFVVKEIKANSVRCFYFKIDVNNSNAYNFRCVSFLPGVFGYDPLTKKIDLTFTSTSNILTLLDSETTKTFYRDSSDKIVLAYYDIGSIKGYHRPYDALTATGWTSFNI